jgi:SAM-dependent methyltransferase
MSHVEDTMDALAALLPSETERWRFDNLMRNLTAWRPLFSGRRVLDFGASWGISAIALIRAGAAEVVGVEPDLARVEKGRQIVHDVEPSARISLLHTPDTLALPFREGEFPFVLSNGVLEHIPQPRAASLRAIWRLVAPGGHLMISETPNKYWPKDTHTTGLWFNHWLPIGMAHRRAVRRGRFRADRQDWASSGWRGMGYLEMVRPLTGYRLIHDNTRWRHRVLAALGLPASLIDPDPLWILRKHGHSPWEETRRDGTPAAAALPSPPGASRRPPDGR